MINNIYSALEQLGLTAHKRALHIQFSNASLNAQLFLQRVEGLTWDNLNRLIQSNHNGQITDYGYDVFGRRLFKKNHQENSLTLFGWDGDLMIWESMKSNKVQESYTKHYVYEPNSFVPLLQTGYTGFIQL